MIVALCANPAVDVTYRVPALGHGQSHTVEMVWTRPGGKGTNVARVLHQLGEPVTLVAPLGGSSGAGFRAALTGVPLVAVDIAGTTRTCVTVVDHDATVFNERGPQVTESEWLAVVDAIDATLHSGDVLVLSGSIPLGVPVDAYANLVTLARRRDARTVVDAHSEVLARALAVGPDVVAPNVHEAAALLDESDPATLAALLHVRGARAAVVSAGRQGVFANTGPDTWRAAPPQLIEGNPTGAGDALTAALAAGLHNGAPWPDPIRDAIACSAAAVACAVAGEIDLAVRAELLPLVDVERL